MRLVKPCGSTPELPNEEGRTEQLAMSVKRLVYFLFRNIESLADGRGLLVDSHGQSIKKRKSTLYEERVLVYTSISTKSCFFFFLNLLMIDICLFRRQVGPHVWHCIYYGRDSCIASFFLLAHYSGTKKAQTDSVIQRRFLRLLSGTEKEVHKGFDCNVEALVMFS